MACDFLYVINCVDLCFVFIHLAIASRFGPIITSNKFSSVTPSQVVFSYSQFDHVCRASYIKKTVMTIPFITKVVYTHLGELTLVIAYKYSCNIQFKHVLIDSN